MSDPQPRPSELAITIATFPNRYSSDGWSCADEVRGRLKLLGFECSTQQVAAWLAKMARTDAPWVERRRDRWLELWEYRVTNWGRNDIDNKLPGFWWAKEQARDEAIRMLERRHMEGQHA